MTSQKTENTPPGDAQPAALVTPIELLSPAYTEENVGPDYEISLKPRPGSMMPEKVVMKDAFALEFDTLNAYYKHVVKNERVRQHPLRTAAILNDFAPGFLGPDVYRAALLHDIGQAATQTQSENVFAPNAKRTLLLYYGKRAQLEEREAVYSLNRSQSESVESGWEFTHTLLSELDVVEKFSEENRHADFGKSEEIQQILHGKAEPASKDIWLEPASLTRMTRMLELLKTVQVESVLIKAAEMIDNLQHPPNDAGAVFRDVHDAESFYIPLLEIMGMDGMASALRNETYSTRLRNSGHGAFLEKANELLACLSGRDNTLSSIHDLLATLNVGEFDLDHAIQDATQHGMKYGTIELQMPDQEDTVRAIWRIKSPGSLAMKLLDYVKTSGASEDEQRAKLAALEIIPADIVGLTFVADNPNRLAGLFTQMANAISDSPDIEMTHGKRRTESLQIRGVEEFRRLMAGALLTGDAGAGMPRSEPHYVLSDVDIQEDDGPDAYNVAKFTCLKEGIRTEVQFMTEEDRISTRIGVQAHVLYKLKGQLRQYQQQQADTSVVEKPHIEITEEDIEALGHINERMKKLRRGEAGLSEESIKRAKKVWQMIKRVSPLLSWTL
ncbi:hypothetical protein CSA80_00915 [Candidatus Saccharibacteria bacterium]|nr:MAG: hypothetical protein CR973_02240 [Candidatus Saccharibacteria bacterium]PID99314.1 MAG: hypothetical protein CSA80_00915 [Candidatus Saccharibacteria bacterium]